MPDGDRSITLRSACFELCLIDLAGAVQVDIDRQRLGDADGIGKLDGAAIGELRRHHILGEVAGRIGCRTVDLGGVLAGESPAAMRGSAAVGVDDDLAAGQAGVAIRARR